MLTAGHVIELVAKITVPPVCQQMDQQGYRAEENDKRRFGADVPLVRSWNCVAHKSKNALGLGKLRSAKCRVTVDPLQSCGALVIPRDKKCRAHSFFFD